MANRYRLRLLRLFPPHGPYTYFTPKPAGRGRSKYVPASLVTAVRARLVRGEQVAEVLTEISAINAELLARRELI